MEKYIVSSEDYNKMMFYFQKGRKYLIVNEEPDAYVYELENGLIDQILKNFLNDQKELRIIQE